MNGHLSEESLLNHLLEHTELGETEAAHLAVCDQCGAQLMRLTSMVHELHIAGQSQPSDAAMQRYQALFSHVEMRASHMRQVWETLHAYLTWDTRQQPALVGVRSAAGIGYRLLFSTPRADVDLLVQAQGAARRIEGEIMPLAEEDVLAPALVQLAPRDVADLWFETESDQHGRFRLEHVTPQSYRLWITPLTGASLEIDMLEIS